TVLLTLCAPFAPALPGNADLFEAGEPPRRREITDVTINFSAEGIERDEARNVERDEELAGVVFLRLVGVDVLHIAAECSAVERPAEQPEDQREATPFVFADRNVIAVRDPPAVGDRLAGGAVDHPAWRQRLSRRRIGADGAIRGNRGGDVEHDRSLF